MELRRRERLDRGVKVRADMIMVEHRLKELFRVAGRVMVLNFGEKIAEGPPQEIMNDDQVKKAYLGKEA